MKSVITNFVGQMAICALVLLAGPGSSAQVASHKPTGASPVVSTPAVAAATKPVARVNGAVLTETDLLREIYAIFPYAQQHNGVPKSMEKEIRQGALQMIIFEELLYQDARQHKIEIPESRLDSAEAKFRGQFPDKATFLEYLRTECHGSREEFREKIRRSLLIERMLKTEVADKAKVSLTQAKLYYDKNPKQFEHGETFSIQSISIIPPDGASAAVLDEARRKAEAAAKLAKATKSYAEFGRLAEQISEDDWRVSGGDRKAVERSKLPPEVVKAALAMKPGDVSDLIQLGHAYTMFRLNAHTPPGRTPFGDVKASLQADLQKQRTQQLRSALAERLRKGAKIEVL